MSALSSRKPTPDDWLTAACSVCFAAHEPSFQLSQLSARRFNSRQTDWSMLLNRAEPRTQVREIGWKWADDMPTYVSIVNWSGCEQPRIDDVRRAIRRHDVELRVGGMHWLAFLPDEGACTGIMVSTCSDAHEVERLAASILPEADVRVESMMFEGEPDVPGWIVYEAIPPPPQDFRRALLRAITSAPEA